MTAAARTMRRSMNNHDNTAGAEASAVFPASGNALPMEPGFYNMDCMEALRRFPDSFFDLAIVDPPYGGGYVAQDHATGLHGGGSSWAGNERGRWGQRFDRYHIGPAAVSGGGGHPDSRVKAQTDATLTAAPIKATRTGGTWAAKYSPQEGGFDAASVKHWDIAPSGEYFAELARVSKQQIIWGGNYFDLPPTRCFIVWDKQQPEDFSMAMCEYAWTSFDGNAKLYRRSPQGTKADPRFHPTQKPVQLYMWLLGRYAKPGNRILDTHVGSASSLIACHRAGMQYWGFEIDPEYYRLAAKRLQRETAQIGLADLGL